MKICVGLHKVYIDQYAFPTLEHSCKIINLSTGVLLKPCTGVCKHPWIYFSVGVERDHTAPYVQSDLAV